MAELIRIAFPALLLAGAPAAWAESAPAGDRPPVRARASLGDYISPDEYPPEARRRGAEGTVRLVASISPEGRVVDCRITGSSGDAGLDDGTCQLFRDRVRYTPARDAGGHAVPDSVPATIAWRLPEAPAVAAHARANLASYVRYNDYPRTALARNEQGRVSFELDVSSRGEVSYCVVTRSSGSSALDARTCEIMRERARFEPARDAEGNPAPDTVRADLTWRIVR
ncbi:energy transducer TonB [Sphingosinicella terrae]|uniref:energy transducer TonB n=1 Tax=Sphingosinicella terrae TaxID=2172047 RepID=UPI000E0CD42A|nr:energy transducer TonB [Sphingosinicella terrae]